MKANFSTSPSRSRSNLAHVGGVIAVLLQVCLEASVFFFKRPRMLDYGEHTLFVNVFRTQAALTFGIKNQTHSVPMTEMPLPIKKMTC